MRADVVVIGSGAGGAPPAAVLAEAGLEVVVLEAGARLETRDFNGDEAQMLGRLMRADTARDSGIELYAGACVGGSTVVNDALCWRPPPEVLAGWRRDHGLEGLTEEAFAPFVEEVWSAIHASPTDRAHLNRNAHRLEVGAARLGWAAEAMPRNVRDCANLGLCNLGCPSGAKQSALLTWIPRAERAGARVLPQVRAERVRIEAGRVQAVEACRVDAATGAPGEPLHLETSRVVLAAGVLETPALLLRSGVRPPGSGAYGAGRGLQLHSSVHVTARFREPVVGFFGPTMAYAVTEFSDVYGHHGPGFMLENVAVSPLTTAQSLPGFGDAHARVMEALPYLARLVVVLRDATRGALVLDRRGGVRVSYDPVPEDRMRVREAVRQAARLYLEAGAEEVWAPVNALGPLRSEADVGALDRVDFAPRSLALWYAVHLFGGAAMGGSRDASACDETGRIWDVEGLYVADAAALPGNTGANPQVTIMANALRIAGGIAASRGGRA